MSCAQLIALPKTASCDAPTLAKRIEPKRGFSPGSPKAKPVRVARSRARIFFIAARLYELRLALPGWHQLQFPMQREHAKAPAWRGTVHKAMDTAREAANRRGSPLARWRT